MAAVASIPTSLSFASMEANDDNAYASVTEGLLDIGAVMVVQYLNDTAPVPDVPSAPILATLQPPPLAPAPDIPHSDRPTARLHQACQHTFGNADALKFEYEDDPTTRGTLAFFMSPLFP